MNEYRYLGIVIGAVLYLGCCIAGLMTNASEWMVGVFMGALLAIYGVWGE